MNMKNWKNFFRVHGHSAGGFTLVELIVVIAILAILAGVAIPAYSGYIKKAEQAGDLQLLDAINSAYSAACIAAGVDIKTLTPATATISLDGNLMVKLDSVKPASVKGHFEMFYAGNETSAFKTISALRFNAQKGLFEAADGGAYSGLLDIIMANNPEWAATLNNSIWMDSTKGLGTDGLLDKVNDVTKFAAAADNAALSSILNSDEFMGYAAGVLGVDLNDPDAQSKIDAKFNELAAEMVAQNPGMDPADAANQLRANAAVLYAAENTKNMTTADITALLGKDGAKTTIISNMNDNPGTAMSQASIAYGMYTAYAYSTGDQELIASTEDPLAILGGLDDDGFQAYINNPDNAKDIEGYLAAMNMISSSTGDTEAIDQLMVNGFDDPALAAMLNQLGSSK